MMTYRSQGIFNYRNFKTGLKRKRDKMLPKLDLLLPDDVNEKHLLLLAYRGSVAHNMYIPNDDPNSVDDIDLMGVFLAPVPHYIGLSNYKTTIEKNIEVKNKLYDCVYYELQHFTNLLLKGNPNVLSMLWLEEDHYIYVHNDMKVLIELRDWFSGTHIYNSFTGYAYSQLKRMESPNKKGYMGDKRRKLVKKYGYDTKNAAHLIRLLLMGIEFLETGKLNVYRRDADMLLEIKTGKWSLDRVKAMAENGFSVAKEALADSTLPEKPNKSGIESFIVRILYRYITEL